VGARARAKTPFFAFPRATSRKVSRFLTPSSLSKPPNPKPKPTTNVAQAAVKVGDAAPDFTLMGAGFETTALSSLKGQKVVLAFFPAAFSGDADGGCQCQLASLQSIDKEDGISVLGITRDTPFVMGPWSEAAGIKCLCDTSLKTQEAYVGTIDFGKFLDDLDVSTNMAGYMSSKRGCVVLDEDQKVTYTWTGMPDQLPDVTEIQAALGIGKVNFE
jgi:peroxiredoxin